MKLLPRLVLVLAGLTLAFALASCGDSDDGDGTTAASDAATESEAAEGAEGGAEVPAGQADSTVTVSLGEFFIKLDESSVDAGNIAFTVSNDGALEHEFVVIKTDTPPADLPVVDGDVDEEAAGEVPGEIPSVKVGATEDLTLSLDAGKYALICNLPGHYKGGQFTGFTVR
ncbi:MAG: hypothetical protein WBB30_08700 [Solirubrobacterales bacterium]